MVLKQLAVVLDLAELLLKWFGWVGIQIDQGSEVFTALPLFFVVVLEIVLIAAHAFPLFLLLFLFLDLADFVDAGRPLQVVFEVAG
jgi:ABC-type microcin C transport system permease subunit YejE